ncbi:glycosyltransferase [Micromonospora sp. NPDC049679]|uniref:glycosyltransferase n=1 Tax=Micromonospora sp. NPDC049679 TaxID=3155920 RepID=UPI00340FEE04
MTKPPAPPPRSPAPRRLPPRYPLLQNEPVVPTVVWVGRIEPLKDLHTLIRAFQLVRDELPDARLRLAGPVPEHAEAYAQSCHALVDRLGLRDSVDFTGPVANSRKAYAAGHVVALPGTAERIPYTVIEAMMCGRPTVSSDVGGVAEAVGEAGLVVAPGNPVAFAAACTDLLTDPQRRRELGAAARRRALAHFTTGKMLPVYEQLYRDVRAHGAQGAPLPRRAAHGLQHVR